MSCSAKDLRLGLNVHYHFSPGESFDPWVGLGAGYEWLVLDESAGGVSVSETASGFEFGNLQLGGDFAVAPNFGIGPFFTFTLAQYSHLGGAIDTDLAHEGDPRLGDGRRSRRLRHRPLRPGRASATSSAGSRS